MKSGSDYKNFTEIDLKVIESDEKENISFTNDDLNDDNVVTGKEYTYNIRDKFKASIKKRDITRDIVPVASIQKHVDFYDEKMHEAMKRVTEFLTSRLFVTARLNWMPNFPRSGQEKPSWGISFAI